MKNRILKTLSIIVVFSIFMPTTALGNPTVPPEITALESEIIDTEISAQTSLDLDAAYQVPDGRVSLIVELQQPPLGLVTLPRSEQLDIQSASSQNYLLDLTQKQDQVISEITKLAPSADIGLRYRAVFNGFNVFIDPAEANSLLKLDSVKRIYPDRRRSLLLDSSTDVINAPSFWADLGGQANAGEGIRIAIIDTGIRSENLMFDGRGYVQPPAFPRGYCADAPPDPDFQCNDKLIAARYYAPTFAIHAEEVLSPLDIHGHGSHVAGIAAGNPVTVPAGAVVPETTAISGVAPGAYLMVYKALFVEPDGAVTGTDSMFLAALDDALIDGADVVNSSWGESENQNPADSPFQTAVAALNASGVVVVFAAGNGGPNEGSISCPGCLEDVITVGASTADRIFANTLDLVWPMMSDNPTGLAALSGTGPEIGVDIDAEILYAGTADPSNFDGCSSFASGIFSGSIALIQRGGCSFLIKVNNAAAAGAVAVVIFNNEPGFPVRMNSLGSTTISAVFMSKDQGELVRDWIISKLGPMARINAGVTAVRNAYWQDALWVSSSFGPNGNPDVLKPDIVAPGFYILSATSPVFSGGQNYQFFQGTSMAAPHVAGAAALMIQKHPAWTPQQIKTALTSTAAQQIYQSDGSTPATPFMRGAGRIDLASARNAGLTFSQPSFADSQCNLQCSWQVELKNETLNNNFWWDAVVNAPAGLHIQVDPSYIILGLGESRTFTVTVDVSGLPLDHWYFGNISWQQKTSTHPDANLPLAVFATEPNQASLEKTADRALSAPGDTATYAISLLNDSPLTTTFTISDPIPINANYVPGSASGGLVYDSVYDVLTGTVEVSGAHMDIINSDPFFGGYQYPLASLGFSPTPCPTLACDDDVLILSGLDFYYNGRHVSELVWSTNGFLQVGAEISNFAGQNQNLPSPTAPNNLIAPLWADFDLDGGDGVGHGTWYSGFVTDGTYDYYVFEWKDVALKSDPTRQSTFQVWIKRGTSEIWLIYGPQIGVITTATVGLENQYGSVGHSSYFNGMGVIPIEGDSLKTIQFVDEAVLTYALEMGPTLGLDVTNTVQVTNSRTNQVMEDTATIQISLQTYLPLLIR